MQPLPSSIYAYLDWIIQSHECRRLSPFSVALSVEKKKERKKAITLLTSRFIHTLTLPRLSDLYF